MPEESLRIERILVPLDVSTVSTKISYVTTKINNKKVKRGNLMEEQNVTIVDVRMPFMSMVVFMVKAALASIPAVIVLAVIFGILGAIFGGMFGMG